MIKVSPSSLALYNECPFSWWLAYDLKVPIVQELTPQIILGKSFHSCISKFLNGQTQTREWLQRLWKMHAPVPVTEEMKGDVGVKNWWGWYQKTLKLQYKVKLVESKFTKDMFGSIVSGRIDAVFHIENKKFLVVDWKTGTYDLRNIELGYNVRQSMQLFLYGCAVMERYDVLPEDVELGFYYSSDDQYGRCSLVDSIGEEKVKVSLEGIESKNYSKKISSNCEFCDYKTLCNPFSVDTL